MAVTQLARKGRVNKTRSRQRKQLIKLLTFQPVIKNVDIESIKKEFEAKKTSSASAKKAPAPATSAE